MPLKKVNLGAKLQKKNHIRKRVRDFFVKNTYFYAFFVLNVATGVERE